MGEYILKEMVSRRGLENVITEIDSCAVSTEELGNPVYPPARAELARHGIPCGGHRARQITKADCAKFDLILTMDRSNMRLLERRGGAENRGKVRMLLGRDVADPWYTGDFTATYDDLIEGCEQLLKELE